MTKCNNNNAIIVYKKEYIFIVDNFNKKCPEIRENFRLGGGGGAGLKDHLLRSS